MTTPDTEWEKELKPRFSTLYDEDQQSVEILQVYFDAYWEKLKPRIHSLLSSRDTYWKERVRKEVEMYFGVREDELTAELANQINTEGRTDKHTETRVYEARKNRDELLEKIKALDTLLDNLK